MDSSNQPAENPAPAPQPVVPKASAPAASNGVVPAGKPGSSKGLIIGLIIGGVAIVGITLLCIFLIPALFGIDWESTHEAAETFKKASNGLSSDCSDVMTYFTSSSTTDDKYSKYVSECDDAVKKYTDAIEELGKTPGVKKDADVKKKWEDFEKTYNEAKPFVESFASIFGDFHTFYIKAYNLYWDNDYDDFADMSDSDVEEITKSLRESDTEGLKKLGETVDEKLKKVVSTAKTYEEAKQAYYDASYNDPNLDALYDAYDTASDDYYDAVSDFSDAFYDFDTEDIFGVDEDILSDLDKKADNLIDEIDNKYRDSK